MLKEDSDDEQGGPTIKRNKKKPLPKQDSDDEKGLTRKKIKELPLLLVHIQTKKEISIKQNVEVKRKKTNRSNEILLEDKTLVINDGEISRNQCEFKKFQKGYTIADHGSANGTYIMLKKE